MLRPLITMILSQRLRSSVTATGLRRMYRERVVDHYDNPRNVRSFDKKDPNVEMGLFGAPACGDVMKLQIRVDEESGKIIDACFKTFGCSSAIASSSVGCKKPFLPFLEVSQGLWICSWIVRSYNEA